MKSRTLSKFISMMIICSMTLSILFSGVPLTVFAGAGEDVLADYEELALGVNGSVISNIELPQTGSNGSSISWTSDNPAITVETLQDTLYGVVHRPVWDDFAAGTAVKLTAVISKDAESLEKEFNVIVQPQKANMVSNPGFENNTIAPWVTGGSLGLVAVATTAEKHGGDYSARIDKSFAYDRISVNMPFVSGKTYVVSAWFKAGLASDTGKLVFFDPTGPQGVFTEAPAPINNSGWTQIKFAHNNTLRNQVQLRTTAATTTSFYVDDIYMAEAMPETVTITGGADVVIVPKDITLQFNAAVVNQVGTTEGLANTDVEWSLVTPADGVSIDSTGRVAITSQAQEGKIKIRASSADYSFVFAEKEILLKGPQPPQARNVSVSGDTVVGRTLTGSYTYYSESRTPEALSSFRWLWSDTIDGEYTEVNGAAELTYSLSEKDFGKYFKFEVTPISISAPTTGAPVRSAATSTSVVRDNVKLIDVSETDKYLIIGDKTQILVSGKSKTYDTISDLTGANLTYSVSNTRVLTVDSKGIITAKAVGSSEITVSLDNPDSTTVSDTIVVNVKKKDGGGTGGGSGSGGGSVTITVPKPTQIPSVITPVLSTDDNPKTKDFEDVKNHWAKSEIEFAISKNIVKGISEASFAPDINISRAELAALIIRVLDLNASQYGNAFTDVASDSWYANTAQTISEVGIMGGYSGLFRPNDAITREELAKVIVEAYKYATGGSVGSGSVDGFQDKDSISDWAKEYVGIAFGMGFVKGVSDNAFEAKNNATRAQAVVIIKRLYEKVFIEKPLPAQTSAPATTTTPAPTATPSQTSLPSIGTEFYSFESAPLGFELSGADVSTEQAHTGTKSIKMSGDSATATRNYPQGINNVVTVWLYDHASPGEVRIFARVDDGTQWRAIGIATTTSKEFYVVRESADYEVPYTITKIKRTKGWHKFQFDLTNSGKVDYYIDNVKVNTTEGSLKASQIAIVDFWPEGAISNVFIDDIEISSTLEGGASSAQAPAATPVPTAPAATPAPTPPAQSGTAASAGAFSFEAAPLGFELSGAEVSSEQAHTGTKSVKIKGDSAAVTHNNPEAINKVVTIWIYDHANPSEVRIFARVDDGTQWRGIGIATTTSKDYYVIRDSADYQVPFTVTKAKRTKGWHKLQWDLTTSGKVDYYIDGEKVGTTEGGISAKQIAVVDLWAEGAISNVFVDDIEITDGI